MNPKRIIQLILIVPFLINLHCDPKSKQEKNLYPLLVPLLTTTAHPSSPSAHCGRLGNGFWVRNISTNQSECISRTFVGEGNSIRLYVETGLSVAIDFHSFIGDFDTKIHPRLVSAFGTPSDTNGDGKVDVFILDIRDGAVPNGPFVAGFFDPVDLYMDNPLSFVRSNEREILYMDGRELVRLTSRDPLAFGSTLAHEYQHLIRFPRMSQANETDSVWINEGTSELASDLAGFGPQSHRIRCLIGHKDSPCVGGGNGVSLLQWGTGSSGDESYILKQYSYAYAFLRYLYHSSGGDESRRNQFLFESVNGNAQNIRGSNVLALMELFRRSTQNTTADSSNPLGATTAETFQILLHGFWGQILDGSDLTRITRSGNPVTQWNLGYTFVQIPLDDILVSLKTNTHARVDRLPSQIRSSAMVFANGDLTSNVSAVTTTNRITSTPNSAGSFLLFAESNPNSTIQTTSQVLADIRNPENPIATLPGRFPPSANRPPSEHTEWDPPSRRGYTPQESVPICGHPYIEWEEAIRHRIRIKKGLQEFPH